MDEWKIFARLEPWGYEEKDIQESFTRYATAQAQGVKKKSGQPITQDEYSIEAFRQQVRERLKTQGASDQQDPEEMKRMVFALFTTTKGK